MLKQTFFISRTEYFATLPSHEAIPGNLLPGTRLLVGSPLGQGGFGKVFKASRNGVNYAIKITKNRNEKEKRTNEKEASILKCIFLSSSTDHLLRSPQQFPYGPNFVCLMEELHISLYSYVVERESGPLKPEIIKNIFEQVLLGSNALLELGYVHCDLKLDNIMLCKGDSLQIKLVDFGLAVPIEEISTKSCGGSLGYMAPEVVFGFPCSEKVDSWSIGCVLFALFTGFELFWPNTKYQLVQQFLEVFGSVPSELQDSANIDSYFCKDESNSDRIYFREPSCGEEFAPKPYDRRGFEDLTEFGYNSVATPLDNLLVRFIKLLIQPAPSMRKSPQETLVLWKQLCIRMKL